MCFYYDGICMSLWAGVGKLSVIGYMVNILSFTEPCAVSITYFPSPFLTLWKYENHSKLEIWADLGRFDLQSIVCQPEASKHER